ncbi:D-lactaldehyde dehydrogenase [Pseudohyphozyma bogoriensis]|nr:D-lactaldehyde dehydrogenase [Pseudohyphozyma bogoriensis]
MPSVPPSSNALVLVTGASGFLATWISLKLLQKGFKVRGTVRSPEKGDYLTNLFKKEGLEKNWDLRVRGCLAVMLIGYGMKEGAFDEAVKGVDAIEHTAAPFHFNVVDPYRDMIDPTVNGCLAILKAALTEPKVQRVVLTGSFAAILSPKEGLYDFSEKDWNEYSVGQVELLGKDVHPGQVYRAGKTLAEKAAWKFMEDITKDGKAPFDLAVVIPPMILGPVIHQFSGEKGLNTSVNNWYQFLIGNRSEKDALSTVAPNQWVDVRDAAQIHVDAISNDAAANHRLVVNAGPLFFQTFLDFMHAPAQKALLAAFPKTIKGSPGADMGETDTLDCTRVKEGFGWSPIPWEQSIKDMTESLAERQKTW